MSSNKTVKIIPAIKVTQWLNEWNKAHYDVNEYQKRPKGWFFYIFPMKAKYLKALTGVYRRSAKGGMARIKDPNVQRGHEEERSQKIRNFVQFGYPWCDMNEEKRESNKYDDLRKPGWLPTSIIVNILEPGAERNGITISSRDLIIIEEKNGIVTLKLPDSFSGSNWSPSTVYPLEVIDGQHRLWAFESFDPGDDYELPVVAFYGLDRGWQAYLFWTINITPVRINKSLAFDLYPLLRQQTWLDAFMGHAIYRETRCQELVENLWAYPESPWYLRINMLGEKKDKRDYKGAAVTQAAWVRSLMASFVKPWEGEEEGLGGLFGASRKRNWFILPWTRAMQAAFLIFVGNALKNAVKENHIEWAEDLRRIGGKELAKGDDPAFYGEFSLLTTDQGIRGFLFIFNDLCCVMASNLKLDAWTSESCDVKEKRMAIKKTNENASSINESRIKACIDSLSKTKVAKFINAISDGLASYDWRTSATPNLLEDKRKNQALFRGGSGYKEMRRQLILHLCQQKESVGEAAKIVKKKLGC